MLALPDDLCEVLAARARFRPNWLRLQEQLADLTQQFSHLAEPAPTARSRSAGDLQGGQQPWWSESNHQSPAAATVEGTGGSGGGVCGGGALCGDQPQRWPVAL